MDKSAMRRFAFWGSATLSTSTHRHYDESVYRIKQHTRGNNTIPYHRDFSLVTFEMRRQRAHCYPRRVATVLSTSLYNILAIDGNSPLIDIKLCRQET